MKILGWRWWKFLLVSPLFLIAALIVILATAGDFLLDVVGGRWVLRLEDWGRR